MTFSRIQPESRRAPFSSGCIWDGNVVVKNPEVIETEIQVRYSETDQMGVTYYANYFVWFEVARTDYFRKKGVDYRTIEERGIYLAVVDTQCRYLAPTRYDDRILVRTWLDQLGKSSIHFKYELVDKMSSKKVAEGTSSHVFVDRNIAPVRIPEEVVRAML